MAEATVFRNNALPYPVYGVSYTVVFPLLDADGDPISPSSPDSERSLNGDTFADCTNEATEIATTSGICYLTLTAAEMTADIVAVRIQSTGAKTTVLTLYPRKLAVLSSGTCQGANDTGDIQLAAGDSAIDDIYNGCLCVAVIDSTTEARIINDYVGSTKVGEVSPAWNTAVPDNNDTYTIYMPEGRSVNGANVTGWVGTAPAAYSTTRGTAGTALPAAAADAAGGLPISDAGGFDVDATVQLDDLPANFQLTSINGDGVVEADMVLANGLAVETFEDTEVADAVLLRDVSNVEDTLPEHSMGTIVLAMLENEIDGTDLTIFKTDGVTEHITKVLSVDPAASPIVGIA